MDLNKLRHVLRQNHLSMTSSRKLVFEILKQNQPLTIANIVKKTDGRVNRASIYRCVKLFENLQIVQRINIGWKYKIELTDLFNDHHHHAHCLECGQILTLPASLQLENQIVAIAQNINFKLVGHQIELTGICAECIVKKEVIIS